MLGLPKVLLYLVPPPLPAAVDQRPECGPELRVEDGVHDGVDEGVGIAQPLEGGTQCLDVGAVHACLKFGRERRGILFFYQVVTWNKQTCLLRQKERVT